MDRYSFPDPITFRPCEFCTASICASRNAMSSSTSAFAEVVTGNDATGVGRSARGRAPPSFFPLLFFFLSFASVCCRSVSRSARSLARFPSMIFCPACSAVTASLLIGGVTLAVPATSSMLASFDSSSINGVTRERLSSTNTSSPVSTRSSEEQSTPELVSMLWYLRVFLSGMLFAANAVSIGIRMVIRRLTPSTPLLSCSRPSPSAISCTSFRSNLVSSDARIISSPAFFWLTNIFTLSYKGCRRNSTSAGSFFTLLSNCSCRLVLGFVSILVINCCIIRSASTISATFGALWSDRISNAERCSPYCCTHSMKFRINGLCRTVSLSPITQQWRLARVMATLSRRWSFKKPIPSIPPLGLLRTNEIMTASRSPPWNPSTLRICNVGATSDNRIDFNNSTCPL